MSPVGAPARRDVAISVTRSAGASGEPHEALGAVRLALGAGEVGAVVGPSGCGKTTLLRIVAGLDKRFEGAVTAPADHLAVVFQEPRLLPWRSVQDNIRIVAPGLSATGLETLLASLGLAAHRRHFPAELSLGLARRVAIARALAVNPELLLLDEPFASLDAGTADALIGLLAAQFDARSTTALIVSHDIEAAARLADVVFVLSGRPGRLVGEIRIDPPRMSRRGEDVAEALRRIAAVA